MQNGAAVLLKPFSGILEKHIDPRRMTIMIFYLSILSCAGYAISGSVGMLLFSRVLVGFATSITGTLFLTIASDALPVQKLASGIAIFGIAGNAGAAVGPIIAEAVFKLFSGGAEVTAYRAVFIVSLFVNAAALIPCHLLVVEKDSPSALEEKSTWYRNIFEIKALVPAIMHLLIMSAKSLTNSYMVLYCEELGLGGVASFYLVQFGGILTSRVLMGKVMDRVKPETLYVPLAVIYALAFVYLGLARTTVELMLCGAAIAFCVGGMQPAVQTMCIQAAGEGRRSAACSTSSLGLWMGCLLGPVLFGGVIYPLAGRYSFMFLTAAIPTALSIVMLVIWRMGARVNKFDRS